MEHLITDYCLELENTDLFSKERYENVGVRRMPVSDEEETIFTFYSFSLDPKP